MNIVTLEMGDPSGDGHQITHTIVIETNLTKGELIQAYAKGERQLGFEFAGLVANNYEDNVLPHPYFLKFKELGFDQGLLEEIESDEKNVDSQSPVIGDYGQIDEDTHGYALYQDTYVDLWLGIAKLGNPEFTYTIKEDADVHISIGGYGLFS